MGACANDEPAHEAFDHEAENKTGVEAILMSSDEAIEIAEKSYANFYGKLRTPKSRDSYSKPVAITQTHSRATEGDTIAYIVNFPNNEGYAIIRAFKNSMSPVLAVVEDGFLGGIDEITVPAQKEYIQTMLSTNDIATNDVISRGGSAVITPVTEEKYEIDTLYSHRYGVVSELKWGQGSAFGAYCDNGLCGCFPLATLFVMAHYEEAAEMKINFTNKKAPSVNTVIHPDWKNIKRYGKPYDGYWNMPTQESITNIGLIARQIGAYAKSEYKGWDGGKDTTTSTSESNAIAALKTIFPQKSVSGWSSYDKTGIAEGLKYAPVIMSGQGSAGGHAWVAEAYEHSQVQVKYYTREYMHLFWTLVSTTYREEEYMYFNWGWYGTGDGYYNVRFAESFTPSGTHTEYKKLKYVTIK